MELITIRGRHQCAKFQAFFFPYTAIKKKTVEEEEEEE